MATKLHGMLRLSRIRKDLISVNGAGEKVIYIDVVPNKNGADQYGNTHALTMFDRDEGRPIYLANLKPEEFGATIAHDPAETKEDLSF